MITARFSITTGIIVDYTWNHCWACFGINPGIDRNHIANMFLGSFRSLREAILPDLNCVLVGFADVRGGSCAMLG